MFLSPGDDLPALCDLTLTPLAWAAGTWCTRFRNAGVFPQLRTLRLEGEFPAQAILDQLSQLKSLPVVWQLPASRVSLPRSLRHFGHHPRILGIIRVWPTEFVVRALRVLEDLRLVMVTQRALHVTLEEMCRDNHVDFATYRIPHYFPEPRNVDWI
ncbi:hypothetical protein FA95DRAFT_1575375 [Auriscalpium vulgare]|uniref:Uncharacterized protein n=1 Tax=Auriscalpium vulgare TaxID=40419 RepID=A0ACB8RFY3_9AGAM|nr:hypothetical protein FA95DRAFT_1575375 [Auriscalpium vulgare]